MVAEVQPDAGYTQSAVSQQIAELERRVGSRVLNRRPVTPTEPGTVLLAAETAVQTAMSITAAELAAVDEGTSGTVRLGAFVSAAASIVPPALARLRSSNPAVHVTLRQLETSQSYHFLVRGDLDLAVTFDYDRAPQPAPDGIVRRMIRTDPVLAILPRVPPAREPPGRRPGRPRAGHVDQHPRPHGPAGGRTTGSRP